MEVAALPIIVWLAHKHCMACCWLWQSISAIFILFLGGNISHSD